MTPELEGIASGRSGRRSRLARALLALGAALVLQGCVSARPWRDCLRPCDGAQLAKAEQVQIFLRDGSEVRLTRVRAGADESGEFLVGTVGKRSRGEPQEVRIESGEICAVRTRRIEAGRVAANVVLVPLAVVANVAGVVIDAKDGEQEFEPVWWGPTAEPPPDACTWRRAESPDAAEPGPEGGQDEPPPASEV